MSKEKTLPDLELVAELCHETERMYINAAIPDSVGANYQPARLSWVDTDEWCREMSRGCVLTFALTDIPYEDFLSTHRNDKTYIRALLKAAICNAAGYFNVADKDAMRTLQVEHNKRIERFSLNGL